VNLAAAAKEAGLSSYVNNDEENVEDEKKDRVLLAQLVEAAKGRHFIFVFDLIEPIFISFSLFFSRYPAHDDSQPLHYQRDEAAAGARIQDLDFKHWLFVKKSGMEHQRRVCGDLVGQERPSTEAW